jgi:hypothetical protein
MKFSYLKAMNHTLNKKFLSLWKDTDYGIPKVEAAK